jgi:hypothetical protein
MPGRRLRLRVPAARVSRLAATLLVCGSFFIANGQTTTATLLGVVRDDSGAAVSFTRTGVSNDTGAYLITNLPLGLLTDSITVDGAKARQVKFPVNSAKAEWHQNGPWIETTTPVIELHEVVAIDL